MHYPFRCTFEEEGDCALEQSEDDDEDWHLITAREDSSFGGFDHTMLSGRIISLLSKDNKHDIYAWISRYMNYAIVAVTPFNCISALPDIWLSSIFDADPYVAGWFIIATPVVEYIYSPFSSLSCYSFTKPQDAVTWCILCCVMTWSPYVLS